MHDKTFTSEEGGSPRRHYCPWNVYVVSFGLVVSRQYPSEEHLAGSQVGILSSYSDQNYPGSLVGSKGSPGGSNPSHTRVLIGLEWWINFSFSLCGFKLTGWFLMRCIFCCVVSGCQIHFRQRRVDDASSRAVCWPRIGGIRVSDCFLFVCVDKEHGGTTEYCHYNSIAHEILDSRPSSLCGVETARMSALFGDYRLRRSRRRWKPNGV